MIQTSEGAIDIGDYTASLLSFDPTEMRLQLDFSSPLSVSVGSELDKLECVITSPNLFISKETALPVDASSEISTTVPR